MFVEINTSENPPIDWGATGAAEIVQNVYTLVKTYRYEVAYDRTLGISPEFVDLPEPEAVPLITAELYRIIDEREPRATVEDVTYLGIDEQGNMQFKVVIDV